MIGSGFHKNVTALNPKINPLNRQQFFQFPAKRMTQRNGTHNEPTWWERGLKNKN